jgi:hypothetical protein
MLGCLSVSTLDRANRRAFLLGLGVLVAGGGYAGYQDKVTKQDARLISQLQNLKNSKNVEDHKQLLRTLLGLVADRGVDHNLMEDLAKLISDMNLESFIYCKDDFCSEIDKRLSNSIMRALIKGQDHETLLQLVQAMGANEHCQGSDKAQAMFALRSILDPVKIGLARISTEQDSGRKALRAGLEARQSL